MSSIINGIRRRIAEGIMTPEQREAQKIAKAYTFYRKYTPKTPSQIPEKTIDTFIKGIGVTPRYIDGFGIPHEKDVKTLRALAKTPTPAACIRRLITDACSAEWDIVAVNPKEKDNTKIKQQIEHIRQNILIPNFSRQTFQQVIAAWLDDLLTLDMAVITKGYSITSPRFVTQFWVRDAASFLIEVDEYGNFGKHYPKQIIQGEITDGKETITATMELDDMTVGYWQHPTGKLAPPIPFQPHEVIYGNLHPVSYSLYGVSAIEILKTRLEIMLQSDISLDKFFRRNEIARALFTLDSEAGLDDHSWNRFKNEFDTQLNDLTKPIIRTDQKGSLTNIQLNRKDVQWIEQQKEYRLSVMALFNVTPIMLGWTEDVPKATEQTQREIYLRKGLMPILKLIEYKMNIDYITEFYYKDEENDIKGRFAEEGEPKVYFTFDFYDPLEEQYWLERAEYAAKSGVKTINEMRQERGLPPVVWGDYNPAAMLAIQQFAQGHFMAPDVITTDVFCNLTGIPKEDVEKTLKNIPNQFEDMTEKKAKQFWSQQWNRYKAWRINCGV